MKSPSRQQPICKENSLCVTKWQYWVGTSRLHSHHGIIIMQQIAVLINYVVLLRPRSLVKIFEHGPSDEIQKSEHYDSCPIGVSADLCSAGAP